jgi:hypothetical protein
MEQLRRNALLSDVQHALRGWTWGLQSRLQSIVSQHKQGGVLILQLGDAEPSQEDAADSRQSSGSSGGRSLMI